MNFKDLNTKTARVNFIRHQLGINRAWALRGLVRIFKNQTADEQMSETTKHHNNIGFTGADAEILTSMAKWHMSGRTLSSKQMAVFFRRMPKYARQLEGVSR